MREEFRRASLAKLTPEGVTLNDANREKVVFRALILS